MSLFLSPVPSVVVAELCDCCLPLRHEPGTRNASCGMFTSLPSFTLPFCWHMPTSFPLYSASMLVSLKALPRSRTNHPMPPQQASRPNKNITAVTFTSNITPFLVCTRIRTPVAQPHRHCRTVCHREPVPTSQELGRHGQKGRRVRRLPGPRDRLRHQQIR